MDKFRQVLVKAGEIFCLKICRCRQREREIISGLMAGKQSFVRAHLEGYNHRRGAALSEVPRSVTLAEEG